MGVCEQSPEVHSNCNKKVFGSSFSPVQTCPGAHDCGVWELTPSVIVQPDWALKTGVKLVPVVQLETGIKDIQYMEGNKIAAEAVAVQRDWLIAPAG